MKSETNDKLKDIYRLISFVDNNDLDSEEQIDLQEARKLISNLVNWKGHPSLR